MFYSASQFNRDLSAWDVRVVADMTDMFLGPIGSLTQSQSLCGYHWMQSSTAQLAFPNTILPQIAIDQNGTICHCPRGTYYQSRVWPSTETANARLETCPPCPSGQYSPGGKVPSTFCSECPAGFYCVTPAVKAACPLGAYCPVKSTFPTALTSGYYAVNALHTYNGGTQGVAERVCEKGYYCSGGIRKECSKGEFCPLGTSAPRPCLKGSFCNVTFIHGLVPVWGTSEEPCSGTYCPRGSSEPIPCADGATCFVPASPELVLIPDMFDLVESEVGKRGGSIQYQLSLSAQPNASVIVKIKLNITSEECYAYNESSKFELVRMEFEFGPDNYNISQIVVSQSLPSQLLFLAIIFFSQSLFFTNTFSQSLFLSQPLFSECYGPPSVSLAVRRHAQGNFPTLHRDRGRGLQRCIFTACLANVARCELSDICFLLVFLLSFTIAHRVFFKTIRNALPMPARLKTRPHGSVVVAAWMVITSSTPTRNTATASSNVGNVQKE